MASTKQDAQRNEEQAAAAAREQFISKFQGATLRLKTTFHHRPVIRAYRRTFALALRNWHLATTLARTALADPGAAVKLQDVMLAKIANVTKHFNDRQKVYEALAAQESSFDMSAIGHGASFTEDVVLLGPVAMKFRELLMLCDTVLDHATALYTFGLLPESDFQNANFEVKKLLRGVDASIRNCRILTMKRVNDAGKARPGYDKSASATDEGASPTDEGAPTEAASPAAPAPSETPVDTPVAVAA